MNMRLFKKKKKQKGKGKGAFSALSVSSTQRIIQYGHEEEEYDNEKNAEFDQMDQMRNGPSINIISPSNSNIIRYSSIHNCTRYQCKGNTYSVEPGKLIKPRGTTTSVFPVLHSASNGVVNHSLCLSPSVETSGPEHDQSAEFLMQQTFHFGNLANCDESPKKEQIRNCNENNFSGDSDEDREVEDNIACSSFVPIHEVCAEDKPRTCYCTQADKNDCLTTSRTGQVLPLNGTNQCL